jgi:1,2-diacylglycerol 3-alpha-glucosyltransferase
MRIGMMTDTYMPYVSGITNYISVNKRVLESVGHEVYVFTFGDIEYQDAEPRILRSPGIALSDTGFYLSLHYKNKYKKLLQTMDLVHVHHPFLSGRLALNYCRRPQIPIIFTNHTRYDLYTQARLPFIPQGISHSLLQAYMPDFCNAVDLVISPSLGMKRVLRQYRVTSHIEIVPNGVEIERFHTAQPLSRAKFDFDEQDLLLVYVGRIAPEKNLEFLLQSFTGIAQIFPNVQLLIVGSGQREHVDETRLVSNQLGIKDRVRFIGMVPYNQLPSYLAMCDVFVTASVTEVHPLSVIEGMATGLPVVGIDSPGISDSIVDGQTGLLATEDIASFTAKLTYLCMDKDKRTQMGLAARKAAQQYDIERTTKILLGHYSSLIQNTRPVKKGPDERLLAVLEEFLK